MFRPIGVDFLVHVSARMDRSLQIVFFFFKNKVSESYKIGI